MFKGLEELVLQEEEILQKEVVLQKELINHYTKEGEIVFDPFCGSGMTGVAAVELKRKSILSDLSPAAVFIASNLTTPIDSDKYIAEINKIYNHFQQDELDPFQIIRYIFATFYSK